MDRSTFDRSTFNRFHPLSSSAKSLAPSNGSGETMNSNASKGLSVEMSRSYNQRDCARKPC